MITVEKSSPVLNGISGMVNVKKFWGDHAPDPPSDLRLWRSFSLPPVPTHKFLATAMETKCVIGKIKRGTLRVSRRNSLEVVSQESKSPGVVECGRILGIFSSTFCVRGYKRRTSLAGSLQSAANETAFIRVVSPQGSKSPGDVECRRIQDKGIPRNPKRNGWVSQRIKPFSVQLPRVEITSTPTGQRSREKTPERTKTTNYLTIDDLPSIRKKVHLRSSFSVIFTSPSTYRIYGRPRTEHVPNIRQNKHRARTEQMADHAPSTHRTYVRTSTEHVPNIRPTTHRARTEHTADHAPTTLVTTWLGLWPRKRAMKILYWIPGSQQTFLHFFPWEMDSSLSSKTHVQ